MTDISVVPTERLELAVTPWRWPFADERRAEIDAHFAAMQREKPALWNGRVLMLRDFMTEGRIFRGCYFETDFASIMAWRDWNFPDAEVKNSFAMGALRGSDGGFVLGEMGPHTANAGKIYFPAGTPDPGDITGNAVDLAGSITREVLEETGLTPDEYVADAGWVTVFAGPRVPQMKVLNARRPAHELRRHILDHLAGEKEPELSDIHVVYGPEDLRSEVPPFVAAFLAYMWK